MDSYQRWTSENSQTQSLVKVCCMTHQAYNSPLSTAVCLCDQLQSFPCDPSSLVLSVGNPPCLGNFNPLPVNNLTSSPVSASIPSPYGEGLSSSQFPPYGELTKGLRHARMSPLVLYSEAYCEQMGPIPSSNGSVDIARSTAYTRSPRRCTFQTVDSTELASRSEINTELLMFALISRLRR